MIPPAQLTGAILAGGHSRRMGRDKAGLIVDGEPLWTRQARVLRDAGAKTVGIVRRRDQGPLALPADLALWHDTVTEIGPLAGLMAAMEACETAFVAVLAVDLPRIDADWFNWLSAAGTAECGAIARRASGIFEPLAALYPRAALGEIRARATGADFSLQALAAALVAQQRLVVLPLPASRCLAVENWNFPQDVPASAASSAWAGSESSSVPRL